MYAVIETGGKQYRVEVGTELQVELLDVEPGNAVTLDRVLLVADGDESSIGQPLVDGAAVSAEVLRQDRGDKVISFKYRPKARRRVKKGHRQELTVVRITDIVVGGKSAAKAAAKAESDAKTERQRLEEAAAAQAAKDAELAAKLAETPAATTTRTTKTTKSKAAAKPAAETTPELVAEAEAESTAPPKKTRARAATTDGDGDAPAPNKAAKPRATKKDES
jgi:large subunit ribosomal protein L21